MLLFLMTPRIPLYKHLLTSLKLTHSHKGLKSSLVIICCRKMWMFSIIKWRKVLVFCFFFFFFSNKFLIKTILCLYGNCLRTACSLSSNIDFLCFGNPSLFLPSYFLMTTFGNWLFSLHILLIHEHSMGFFCLCHFSSVVIF